jgi:phosphoglucomutase
VTGWIGARANEFLERRLDGVRRIPYERALHATTTHRHDYLNAYVSDLASVVDMEAIRGAGLHLGVDPLGGAGVHYWPAIAERYKLDLTVVNDVVDQTFRFMPVDWDGRIRTDPSSRWAMQRLIGLKDRFDVAFACDADHDRHGIVTRSAGLLPPNHYLSVAVDHLFRHRPAWQAGAGVGKTVVSSSMIDRVTARLARRLHEVPVGFKWFVGGLADGSIGFAGEESAGATFLRRDGSAWTTDKDGIAAALLSAEITAIAGRDPGEIYVGLTHDLGESSYDRVEAPATAEQRKRLASLVPGDVRCTEIAGERVTSIINEAPGNQAPIGGVKVSADTGWFAARPSGTEELYKIYAESFGGGAKLAQIVTEAQTIVDAALSNVLLSR